MGTKYYVGEKASFVNGGRVYKPGDEIDGDIFTKDTIAGLIKAKKLSTTPPVETEAETAAPAGEKTVDEMTIEELKAFAAENKIDLKGVKEDDKAAILAAVKAALAKAGK